MSTSQARTSPRDAQEREGRRDWDGQAGSQLFCAVPILSHVASLPLSPPLPSSTVIEWQPGKNLTEKVFKKKPKKGTRSSKPITKTEPCDSFFNFFSPPAMPTEEDELDEEEVRMRGLGGRKRGGGMQ